MLLSHIMSYHKAKLIQFNQKENDIKVLNKI